MAHKPTAPATPAANASHAPCARTADGAGEGASTPAQAQQAQTLEQKHEALKARLRELGSVAVAFSGGVDSTLLTQVAHDVLGHDALAVTMRSAFVPHEDLAEARAFCESRGIKHLVVTADILSVPGVAQNPPDRCYLCKSAVYSTIKRVAADEGIAHVVDGGNVDDLADYRPGHKAVVEQGVISPLAECGFTKRDIRELSRRMGLPTWDKPSAACLASRFPYGDLITQPQLERVDAAEAFLHELGFSQCRVRVHGTVARIEVEPDLITAIAAPQTRLRVVDKLKSLGFAYVTLDMQGYRMGSLNETLDA